MVEHFLRTPRAPCAFVNRSGLPRAVCLALPIHTRATVAGAVDYDAQSSTPPAIVRLGPHARSERTRSTVEGLAQRHPLASLTADLLSRLAASTSLAAADRATAGEGVARQRELEETRKTKRRAEADLNQAQKELERLRDDAKAMGGELGGSPSPELTHRLLAAEDKYAAARGRIDGLEIEEKAREDRVEDALTHLQTDACP